MSARKKLFSIRKLYDIEKTDALFVNAVKENITYHIQNCSEYAEILKRAGFEETDLQTIEDLHKIPAIPTLFYKSHELFSIPFEKLKLKSTTSGTKGKPVRVGFDRQTLFLSARMILRTLSYHKLISLHPANYIVLGYQPSPRNHMGVVKTAYGMTFTAPPLHREYALKDNGTEYELNLEGVKNALIRYEKSCFPVRFMGFPSYLYFLLQNMKECGITLKLHKKSKIFTAGGWKQHYLQETGKGELYRLAKEILGVEEENCKDFFGAVEHPIVYCTCKNRHFHVPVYSRVIIRDVKTLEPLPYGKAGLLNLITPLMGSMPLTSVITDDLAVLHEGKSCGCGISSPFFEVLGRSGLQSVKTCAQGAGELLGGIKL